MTEALRRAGRKVLAKAEAMAATRDIEVGSALVEAAGNTTAHAILAQARKKRADLIVMGTHGRRGLSRALMGSDAEMVVREARVPVLLVRSPERPAAHSRRSKERTAGPAVRSGGNSHKAARPAS
jgi:nucleotide-binding universal stress UspA family protein